MAYYSKQQQQFGLKKEGTRGTAEATATVWYPVLEAELEYKLNHLQDEALRGIPDKFAPVPGRKTGTGKIKMNLDPQTSVEMFYSLLGTISSAQQGGSAAYKHTITRLVSPTKPVYTFFKDYGISVKNYATCGVKKVTLAGGVDNLSTLDAEILFKTEGTGSIGSPAYPTQRYQGFQHASVKIGGSANVDVKEWSVEIDNGLIPFQGLALSQDIQDVLAPGKLDIKGSFTAYFTSETERAKFLANTTTTFQILSVGDVAATTYYYTVDLNLYDIRYTAYPFGEDAGLLAAKVTFDGFYATGSSKAIQVDITNVTVSY